MRHRVKGKKLDRSKASRKALVQGLITGLFEHGKIQTTVIKAKYMRPIAEKMITKAKVDNLSNRRLLLSRLQNDKIAKKLFEQIAPQYKERAGGYLSIKRSYLRKGDATQMAVVSLIEPEVEEKEEPKQKKKTSKSTSSARSKSTSKSKKAKNENNSN